MCVGVMDGPRRVGGLACASVGMALGSRAAPDSRGEVSQRDHWRRGARSPYLIPSVQPHRASASRQSPRYLSHAEVRPSSPHCLQPWRMSVQAARTHRSRCELHSWRGGATRTRWAELGPAGTTRAFASDVEQRGPEFGAQAAIAVRRNAGALYAVSTASMWRAKGSAW